ncbi:acetyl-CoA C-acetyltransferase [Thermosulfidibacter takaii ABI70S6]|uniref:Acetyl-CoA C-acetyltransferase n=1 Tax=Thermosulfidibacter takaii (strain DSM 17441 / JCM 13301 / NBRC 103674 / ABI70S6) TaxID=1298851 RepID=A0A0S3QSZ9_THET7|nr:acetyl-CoA C-acetyltransferase [Thermosulfidibacter takaii]BAT71462.1 acetyl-CoA C-acetyltransferase [Thermosulfidibacter takaii ABI70S6]
MREVYILSAVRTAIGNFLGTLSNIPAPKLGSIVIKEAVKRAGIKPEDVDEVIMGQVVQAGVGQAPARQAMRSAGLPDNVNAFTVNKVCGSGLKAVMLGSTAIKANEADVIVAGGMENMSLCPYALFKARTGYRLFNGELVDLMVHDGLWDPYHNFHMGMTGELIAEKYNVSREDMDKFALESNNRALTAIKNGWFKEEIVPVEIPQRKGDPIIFDTDEGPKETTLEKLSKLPPVFKKDGKVTAGNASKISDGASAVVIASKEKVEAAGLKPIAKIIAYTAAHVEPEWVMEAPIPCVKKLLDMTGFTVDDIDLFEHNEAFAAASVAVMRALNIPHEKFNVNGGAVALGHPIGASGARILTTLIYALKNRGLKRGLATLCLGGGGAVAMIVELV